MSKKKKLKKQLNNLWKEYINLRDKYFYDMGQQQGFLDTMNKYAKESKI